MVFENWNKVERFNLVVGVFREGKLPEMLPLIFIRWTTISAPEPDLGGCLAIDSVLWV